MTLEYKIYKKFNETEFSTDLIIELGDIKSIFDAEKLQDMKSLYGDQHVYNHITEKLKREYLLHKNNELKFAKIYLETFN